MRTALIGAAFAGAPLAAHADPDVRTYVMYLMSLFGVDGLPILVKGLEDPVGDVRYQAAFWLGTLSRDAKIALPALERRLSDDSPAVRKAAADAIEMIDSKRFEDLKRSRK